MSGQGEEEERPRGAKLFLGGLSWNTTEEKLREHFGKYGGEIVEAVVMRDRQTGRPRGFGFITFTDPEVADRVVQDVHVIDGRQIDAKKSVPQEAKPKARKVFVGGLAPETTEDDLRAYFSAFGPVAEVLIMQDHMSGRSRGFGFVTFEHDESAEAALGAGAMHDIGGRRVEVKPATPKGSGAQARGAGPLGGPGAGPGAPGRGRGGYFAGMGTGGYVPPPSGRGMLAGAGPYGAGPLVGSPPYGGAAVGSPPYGGYAVPYGAYGYAPGMFPPGGFGMQYPLGTPAGPYVVVPQPQMGGFAPVPGAGGYVPYPPAAGAAHAPPYPQPLHLGPPPSSGPSGAGPSGRGGGGQQQQQQPQQQQQHGFHGGGSSGGGLRGGSSSATGGGGGLRGGSSSSAGGGGEGGGGCSSDSGIASPSNRQAQSQRSPQLVGKPGNGGRGKPDSASSLDIMHAQQHAAAATAAQQHLKSLRLSE